jgi:murein tripeptide amidase MpaA
MLRALAVSATLALTLAAGSAHAQDQQAPAYKTYAGYALIQTHPESARQQLAVTSLNMSIMDEGVRATGGTTWLASPSQLQALADLAIPFDTIVPDMAPKVAAERARLTTERARWQERADALLQQADPDNPPAINAIDDSFFNEFRPYNDAVAPDINEFLDHLLATYPALISRETIGFTQAGNRPIHAYTVSGTSGPAGKPALAFNATAHAREWITPMALLYIMDRLLQGYATDPETTALLDQLAIHFIPVMNPDGYIYSWDSERFWRKNRRNNGDGTFGVDWNRNFSVAHGTGSSFDTSSDTYNGGAPFTESETRAFRDFITNRPNIVAHIDFHAYSQLILYPYGYTTAPVPDPDGAIFRSVSQRLSDTILSVDGAFYTPQPIIDLYPTGGSSTDWVWAAENAFSWGFELRPADQFSGGFDPSPTLIRPTAEENLAAVRELLRTVAAGVTTDFPQGQPATIPADEPTTITVQISPAFSGPLNTSTATLYARSGSGPFAPSTMTPLGSDRYEATLPATPCADTLDYYFTIESTSGGLFTIPAGAPTQTYTAEAITTTLALFDDAETDTGWTVGTPSDTATTGIWERANPQATAAQPEDDHTPAGVNAWITDARAGSGVGTYDIDGGATTLTSPRLDATPPADRPDADAIISYWRWYSNDQGSSPNADSMPVLISNDDGQTWTTLETVTDNANAWVYRAFRVADFVAPTDQVRLRFIARDDAPGSIVEAGVDDLALEFTGCDDPSNPADLAPPFGELTFADISAFLQFFVAQDPKADLAAPQGQFTFADISAFLAAFAGG